MQRTVRLMIEPELIGIVVALLTGLAEVVRQYQNTGRFRLVSLPFRSFKRLIYYLRTHVLRRPQKPTGDEIEPLPGYTLDEAKELFAEQSYEPEWPLSYAYKGEDANLRRYYYDESFEHPHRQMHIRLWNDGDGLEQHTHEEPSGIHHPKAHLSAGNQLNATPWLKKNPTDADPEGFDG